MYESANVCERRMMCVRYKARLTGDVVSIQLCQIHDVTRQRGNHHRRVKAIGESEGGGGRQRTHPHQVARGQSRAR